MLTFTKNIVIYAIYKKHGFHWLQEVSAMVMIERLQRNKTLLSNGGCGLSDYT